jgi:hypothetical protein
LKSIIDDTGEWIDGTRILFSDPETDQVHGSYFYGPEDAPGYHLGPVFANGQIMPSNWLEAGEWNGLYLFVAKNTTNFYSFWWDYARVSDFDYADRATAGYFGHRENKYDTGTAATVSLTDGNVNNCYSLNTVAEETACLAGGDYDTSGDDDDEKLNEDLLIAILVLVLVITFAVLFMCVTGVVKNHAGGNAKEPMAKQDAGTSSSL